MVWQYLDLAAQGSVCEVGLCSCGKCQLAEVKRMPPTLGNNELIGDGVRAGIVLGRLDSA